MLATANPVVDEEPRKRKVKIATKDHVDTVLQKNQTIKTTIEKTYPVNSVFIVWMVEVQLGNQIQVHRIDPRVDPSR